MKNYTELKLGSDIVGFASDIYENEINLTEEAVFDLVSAFVPFLEEHSGKKATELTVSVGHDSRTTFEKLKAKVIEALVSAGVRVIDCGLATTPAMFAATKTLNCDGAIMITAGEHPADRNGLKFLLPTGGIDSEDIVKIISLANESKHCERAEGTVEIRDFTDEYAHILIETVCGELGVEENSQPLKGLKIVVDASNGAGGFFADKVLAPLGADVSCSINLEPDGAFPNHIPNPENEYAVACISDAVINASADFGIVFDADADTVGCFDSDGVAINRNRLAAVASAIALEGCSGATVVTDGDSSNGLKDFVENDLNGKLVRFKRGYKNVIGEALRLAMDGQNVCLAVDSTGHVAFKDNGFFDDGTFLAVKIIIAIAKLKREGKSLFDLIAKLKMPLDSKEFRINIGVDEFNIYGELVIEGVQRWCEAKADEDGYILDGEALDGIRVGVDDGWFALKLSNHEPALIFNLESDSKGGVRNILQKIAPFLYNCRFLDTSALIEYLETPEESEE